MKIACIGLALTTLTRLDRTNLSLSLQLDDRRLVKYLGSIDSKALSFKRTTYKAKKCNVSTKIDLQAAILPEHKINKEIL